MALGDVHAGTRMLLYELNYFRGLKRVLLQSAICSPKLLNVDSEEPSCKYLIEWSDDVAAEIGRDLHEDSIRGL